MGTKNYPAGRALPPGGTQGEVLTKASTDDQDATWGTLVGTVTPAAFVEPTTATPEAIVDALIAAGLMEAS